MSVVVCVVTAWRTPTLRLKDAGVVEPTEPTVQFLLVLLVVVLCKEMQTGWDEQTPENSRRTVGVGGRGGAALARGPPHCRSMRSSIMWTTMGGLWDDLLAHLAHLPSPRCNGPTFASLILGVSSKNLGCHFEYQASLLFLVSFPGKRAPTARSR